MDHCFQIVNSAETPLFSSPPLSLAINLSPMDRLSFPLSSSFYLNLHSIGHSIRFVYSYTLSKTISNDPSFSSLFVILYLKIVRHFYSDFFLSFSFSLLKGEKRNFSKSLSSSLFFSSLKIKDSIESNASINKRIF